MKKLNLLLCAAALIAGCKGSGDGSGGHSAVDREKSPDTSKDSTNTWYVKSLNGFNRKTAEDFHENFTKTRGEYQPESGSFFIPIELFKNMINVLMEERQIQENSGLHPFTDGLRIYFSRSATDEKELFIDLVSTHEYSDPSGTGKTHEDYYDHSTPKAEILFKSSPSKISLTNKANDYGAALYQKCTDDNCDDRRCDYNRLPSYLKRSVAESMVMGYRPQKIETISEWFDLPALYAIANAKDCSGIRVYLASRNESVNGENKLQVAFVLATTKQDGTSYKDDFNCESIKEGFEKFAEKLFEPPVNNGHLCPTNCNVLPPPPPPTK